MNTESTDIKNSTDASEIGAHHMEIHSIKLPPFWVHSPATWFIQAEAQFSISRVTLDVTKYNHVIANLPQDIAESIMDQLSNPPKIDMYENIKKTLISRHSLSIEKRISKLISGEEMGDKKPSDFFRSLIALAGSSGTVGKDLIIKLWYNRIPNLINIALIPIKNMDFDHILETADQIWEASQVSGNISSLMSTESKIENTRIIKLENEIHELKNMISNLNFNSQSRSRSRTPYRGRRFNRSRSSNDRSQNRQHKFCWYHFKFGNSARTCIAPCEYNRTENNTNNQNSSN